MKLTDVLYESARGIWDSYYEHPFIKGIGDGSLDIQKFRYYMIQDYVYLLDYAKVFALGIVKAKDEETMRYFSELVHNILNGEMSIHKTYMKRLEIQPSEVKEAVPALDNTSYTNYMLWVGTNQGLLELCVSILACAWSYQLIGEHLARIPGAKDHEFYGEWISGYSSDEYANGNTAIFDLVNKLGKNISEEQLAQCQEIFINCSRYEALFWDMAFEQKQ